MMESAPVRGGMAVVRLHELDAPAGAAVRVYKVQASLEDRQAEGAKRDWPGSSDFFVVVNSRSATANAVHGEQPFRGSAGETAAEFTVTVVEAGDVDLIIDFVRAREWVGRIPMHLVADRS